MWDVCIISLENIVRKFEGYCDCIDGEVILCELEVGLYIFVLSKCE